MKVEFLKEGQVRTYDNVKEVKYYYYEEEKDFVFHLFFEQSERVFYAKYVDKFIVVE